LALAHAKDIALDFAAQQRAAIARLHKESFWSKVGNDFKEAGGWIEGQAKAAVDDAKSVYKYVAKEGDRLVGDVGNVTKALPDIVMYGAIAAVAIGGLYVLSSRGSKRSYGSAFHSSDSYSGCHKCDKSSFM